MPYGNLGEGPQTGGFVVNVPSRSSVSPPSGIRKSQPLALRSAGFPHTWHNLQSAATRWRWELMAR